MLRNIPIVLALATATRAGAQTARVPLDAPRKSELAERVVTVPLVKSGDFYFVDVEVNGRRFRFTLETGANVSAVSPRLVRELGLPLDTIPGPGGQPMAVTDLATLKFGGATLSGVRAAVSPVLNDPAFSGDGLISLPALRAFVATIDLANRRLTLQRDGLPAPNGRDVLAIAGRDGGGRIDVPITLGGVELPAVIDTRSFFSLMLPDSLEPRVALVKPPQSLGEAAGPSLGAFRVRGARASGAMTIGDVTFERPPLIFRNRPGVVIGVPLLEQLVLTIDQRGRRVRIVPAGRNPIVVAEQSWEKSGTVSRGESSASGASGTSQPTPVAGAAPPTPASGQRTMGFNLAGVPGGALSVRNVVAGSSASEVGLEEGDQLIEFDGTRAADMNATVFRSAAARGKPVRVVVERNGTRLEFTVTPYIVP